MSKSFYSTFNRGQNIWQKVKNETRHQTRLKNFGIYFCLIFDHSFQKPVCALETEY